MDNTIQYKGYAGSVEFYEEDGIFYGKVMGICSLISYKGESAKELLDDFHVHSPGDPTYVQSPGVLFSSYPKSEFFIKYRSTSDTEFSCTVTSAGSIQPAAELRR